MKNESKIVLKMFASAMFVFGALVLPTHADTYALNGSFINNNIGNKIIPNCQLRKEFNYFTNQWTTNEACAPKVIEVVKNSPVANSVSNVNYGGGSYAVSAPAVYTPTYYAAQAPIYSAGSVGGNTSFPCYYCGSNSGFSSPTYWNTPANSWDYVSDSMFDKYYAGGYGSDKGFYQPNDSVVYDDFNDLHEGDVEDITTGSGNSYDGSAQARFDDEDDHIDYVNDWPEAN